ncbi:glycoside hydrolase family 3 N-terminal domain-containing protein [Dermacoccaceae bacterium W4C1]
MSELHRAARQVLMPGFAGTQVPSWLAAEIDQGLGGVCLFGHNVADWQQVRELTDAVHSGGPVLIASDEEGGIVSRLGLIAGSRHVGAGALGSADDLALTRAVAAANGSDLAQAGIDWALGPVADVHSDPDNPVIGVRSFGSDPERVGGHVAAYVAGLRDAGILSCARHFPGHGDTRTDSHLALPRIDIDPELLCRRDLVPFVAAVEAGVDAVMTAHIIFPALDDRPATLSPALIRLLRQDLGFTGLVTSDAMDMDAVAATVGLAEGCVQALLAGVDLVGLGNPVLGCSPGDDELIYQSALKAVVEAAESGRLPQQRLLEAASRVGELARRAGNHPASGDAPPISAADLSAATAALRHSVNLPRLSGTLAVLDLRRRRNVAAGVTASAIARRLVAAAPGSRATTDVEALAPVGDGSDGAAVVITGSPWIDADEQRSLQAALSRVPEAVVVCTGPAAPADWHAPQAPTIRTFGEDLPTAEAVASLLLR